jgi:hypothetical protein
MTTTIVDFLRELVSELSFQAPYFVCQVSIRLYVFLGGMSRLAWPQCLSPLAGIITGKQRSRDKPSGSKAIGLYLEAALQT